jgi:hypothetical protein
VTLHLFDVAAYQEGLRLEDAKAQGFRAINIKLSHGLGLRALGAEDRRLAGESLPRRIRAGQVVANPKAWVDKARSLDMGVCSFHWLNTQASGAEQARWHLSRMAAVGGPDGMGHQCDTEADATWPIWRDYVNAMQDALQRPVVNYSGDWWWTAAGRGWNGRAVTPYHWAAPNAGYLASYPGDTSPHWRAGYGGWGDYAVLQYAVAALTGGTIKVSKSAIRDLTVWAAITGGDTIMPRPDPGNAPPEAWTINISGAEVSAVRARLAAERVTRAALIREAWPDVDIEAEVARLVRELSVPRGAGEVCAPVISTELGEWVSLGGKNSGCVGDSAHTYGYHRGANWVPSSDYSRANDPNGADGPYTSWDYACAGDYWHGGQAALRAMHASLLDRLMDGDPALSMVCEFIGQPFADEPVRYWAVWNGAGTLQNYTGSGHDVWSHVSLFRSRASQRPYLWRTADMPLTEAEMDKIADKAAAKVWKYLLEDPTSTTTPKGKKEAGTYQRYLDSATNRAIAATNTGASALRAALDTAIRSMEVRHEATVAAIEAATGQVSGSISQVEQIITDAGGNPDVAPLAAALRELPQAMETAARTAGTEAADRVTARIAAANRAAAEAVGEPPKGEGG